MFLVLPKVGISDSFEWQAIGNKLYIPFFEIKGIGEVTAKEIVAIGKTKTKIDNLHEINSALNYLPKKSNPLADYGMILFDETHEKKDLDLARVISNCLERGSGEIYSNFINSDLNKFYEENKKPIVKKGFFNINKTNRYKIA